MVNDRIWTAREVVAYTRLSRSTLWRYVRQGYFPPPIQLGPRRIGWLQSDLDAWMENKRASSSPP